MGTIKRAVFGPWIVAAFLAVSTTLVHAGAEDEAVGGAIADGVSTAVGLAAHATELNPLGPVLSVGMKVAVFEYAKTLPELDRPRVYAAAASMWQGAAANNLCIAAALLSGGAFAPACVVVGVAWGMKTWQASEHERQFWDACKVMRAYAQQPELTCIYVPPTPEPALAQDRAQTMAQLTREAP